MLKRKGMRSPADRDRQADNSAATSASRLADNLASKGRDVLERSLADRTPQRGE